MKILSKIILVAMALWVTPATLAAGTGCESMVGKWQGTLNLDDNTALPLDIVITNVTYWFGSFYQFSGTVNGTALSANNSLCSEFSQTTHNVNSVSFQNSKTSIIAFARPPGSNYPTNFSDVGGSIVTDKKHLIYGGNFSRQ